MIYGYARVSAADQNLDSQLEQLKKFGINELVHEKVTGVAKKKEKLDDLLTKLKADDTLVVTRMDRLGRNTVQLLQLVEELDAKGVYLVILDLNIDTRTPTGKFFLTIMAGFAELDRTMIKEKQAAGIRIAKAKGLYKGRVKTYHEKHKGMQHALELRRTTDKSVNEICEITGVSRAAFYRKLKELEA